MSRGRDEGSPAVGAEPWRELKSSGSWDDFVLPEDFAARLHETADLCRHARRGAGTDGPSSHRLLFGGPSGMGKTSAALALARELGQSVLEVDVAELIAADTQEWLDLLANHVRGFDGILVLDHADALLRAPRRGGGSREAHAAVLVRLVDEGPGLPGVVIVCAERVADEDHVTQLHFDQTFNFPEPSPEIRAQIWERHLPADHRIAAADLAYIAQAFRLSGKVIAACCGRARLRADGRAVTLPDLAVALDAEFEHRVASDATLAALSEVHLRAERAEPASARPTGSPVDSPSAARAREVAPEPTRTGGGRRRWLTVLAIALVGAIVAVGLGIALSSRGKAHATTNSRSTTPNTVVVESAYRTKLSQALATLNQARARYGGALASARTPATQAQAAAALAAAHLVAASTLGGLNAGLATTANQHLVAALRAAGNAYGALAQAAYKSNPRSYSGAKGQVATTTAAVSAAVAQVQTALR